MQLGRFTGRRARSFVCAWVIIWTWVATAQAQVVENGVRVHRTGHDRRAAFIRPDRADSIAVRPAAPGQTATAADFVREYGRHFGVNDPAAELVQSEPKRDALGHTHTTFRQVYRGVPVFGGVLRVHQNARGQFTAASGRFHPVAGDLRVVPDLPQDSAIAKARARLAAPGADLELAELLIVDPGWYGDPPAGAHLAYHLILVDLRAGLREAFFVDAHGGKILDQWNLLERARFREVYVDDEPAPVLAREEGDPPTGDADTDAAYDYAGDTYDYLFRAFGRDGIDGSGGDMSATVHLDSTSCPNAFGGTGGTFYCTGVVTDDIVAHEFGHGLTAHTASLIYQNQPGQLNESFSDVIGEVVDLLNGDAAFAGPPGGTPWPVHDSGPGTDTPNSLRTGCVANSLLTVNSPAEIAGDYAAQPASFGPALTTGGTSGDLVVAAPIRACNADLPFGNAGAMAGKVVLVRRGDCTFTEKVSNAQNAGALAVMVMNNVSSGLAPMGGSSATITIPSVGISQADGDLLVAQAQGGAVNVTLRANDLPAVRWLVSEDSSAFGGAIRDMWLPSCSGDPDTANHPLQTCNPNDNGGVHSGSGVPNHAFAILTDGKDFNGQAVNGIGLFKAAAVWYRALTVYLTPTSNFEDAYLAFNQAAADLVETMVKDPRDGSDFDVFTASDAAEVDKALLAVEMNTEGACGASTSVLDPTPPTLCDYRLTIYQDNFEAGVNGWTVSHTGPGGPPTPYDWAQTGALPLGRAGTAWFADDPSIGNCNTIDESAVHSLFSPSIVLPSQLTSPTLMFTHYLESEAFYDGGNVKISVNGAAWQIIPKTAFQHNPYNGALAGGDNTNPMAGQAAWTGISYGGPQWGASVIDLGSFVAGGETVRLRFDFGKDGCTGVDGWYVDDVELFECGFPLDPPLAEPNGVNKPRFISFVVPTDSIGSETALRVRLTSLHHPTNPPAGTPDLSAGEGQYRYVNSLAGKGGALVCADSVNFGTTYWCAKLGCQPEYRDWAAEVDGQVLHVTGDAVAPSSIYEVRQIAESCGAAPGADTCSEASASLSVATGLWGDVVGPSSGAPDGVVQVLDVSAVVDKVKDLPSAFREPRLYLKEHHPDPIAGQINVIDIALIVDSLKGFPYPPAFTIDSCP